MKGVVKFERGSGFVELRDVVDRAPECNQVKVEVKVTGICGSDLHVYHDTINYRIRTPVVMGHEFSGVVVDRGSEVTGVEVGDRVTGEPSVYICGRCPYCLSEHYNLCPDRRVLGYWHDGSFAPYCNATFVHRLPDSVGFEAGALTELLACCVHTVIEQAGVSAADFVAVTGPGPVGLLSAMVAMAEGGTVLLCGTSRDGERLKLASELGVEHVVNVEADDPLKRVQELTQGYGADVVVECSGAAPGIDLALDLVRKRGKVAQMGLPGKPVEVDFEKVAYKELQVSGGVGQRRPAWERSLKLMELGVIEAESLVSHDLPLADWARGFEMMEKQEAVKVLLRP